MNSFLFWLLFAFVTCSLELLFFVLWADFGLYAWISAMTILANIAVVKLVSFWGVEATLGNILYGATFLAADLLHECYGTRSARRAVFVGFGTLVSFFIIAQLILGFPPSVHDTAQAHLAAILKPLYRLLLASITSYIISQNLNVFLFSRLRALTKGHSLWLVNNGSTLLGQAVDTFLFCLIAFTGVYSWPIFWDICITTYVMKGATAIIGTPFFYLGKRLFDLREKGRQRAL